MSGLVLRVLQAEVKVDRACLTSFGRPHDCDNPDQHAVSGSRLAVEIQAECLDDEDRAEWAKAVGGRYELVRLP